MSNDRQVSVAAKMQLLVQSHNWGWFEIIYFNICPIVNTEEPDTQYVLM